MLASRVDRLLIVVEELYDAIVAVLPEEGSGSDDDVSSGEDDGSTDEEDIAPRSTTVLKAQPSPLGH